MVDNDDCNWDDELGLGLREKELVFECDASKEPIKGKPKTMLREETLSLT